MRSGIVLVNECRKESVEIQTVNAYSYFSPVELDRNQGPGFTVDGYTGAVTGSVRLCNIIIML